MQYTMAKEPYITNGGNFKLDDEYGTWLQSLKSSYRKSQIKAAVKVNAEKLRWNWNVGRDLVMRKAEEHWGSGVVERLSLDLRNEFPDEKGFGADNLWLMKRWYLFYSQKLDQVGHVLQIIYNQTDTKLEQVVQVSKTDIDEAKEGMAFYKNRRDDVSKPNGELYRLKQEFDMLSKEKIEYIKYSFAGIIQFK